MRKTFSAVIVPVLLLALATGCGNTTNPSIVSNGVPVSLSMTDDPPAGVDVLFFQVTLTDASLTPQGGGTAVPLVSSPIQIDVTQLQALSAFLGTITAPAGMYTSLGLTFSDPELVIYNQSDTSLGSSCAVGSICQLTPTLSATTLTFSSSPFPVTLAANNGLGLLVDFHLDTVIQPDLSVNLGVANGVSVSALQGTPPAATSKLGAVTGTVESVNTSGSYFTLLTQWGLTFSVGTDSSTTYSDFPASACSAAGFSCVAAGQVVQVQVGSVGVSKSGAALLATQVSYVQAGGTQTAEGTIIKILPLPTPAGEEVVQVILHRRPMTSSTLPLGGVATVTLDSTATYAVDNNGFTIPSGLSFTGTADVMVGQNLQMTIEPGTLSTTSGPGWGGWGPPQTVSFTTNSVELEPSQVTAMITALNSPDFTLGFNFGPWFAAWPSATANQFSFSAVTTSQTTYVGFSPESFSGLATNDLVSVYGWLFPPATSGGSPQIAAEKVVLRSGGWF